MYSRLTCLIALAICLSFSKAYSQNDTSHYDLGRIQLDKKFTQSITIKATDLQRQPFSNLPEAINVWLYGTYTSRNNIIYVIDGNLINDVNAYSINDIEEITLVQNSGIQLSGAMPQQQMVLIKTKRNRPGKSGIEASGQTNFVNLRNSANTPNVKSTTNLFHQYYLSGYKNTDVISTGISATYLRDVLPILTNPSTTVSSPLSFDRFKFNGYADVKLGSNNTLSTTVNYVPQVSRFKYANTNLTPYNDDPAYRIQTELNDHGNQNLFNANIQLNSQIATGLSNKLSASYNHYSYLQRYGFDSQTSTGSNYYNSNYIDSSFNAKKVFLVQDNLSYRKTVGEFTFEPSVNFSYRYTRDSTANSIYMTNYTGTSQQDLNNPSSYSISRDRSFYKRKDYLLLPSLSISYKKSINIQGGFLAVLDSRKSLNLMDTTSLKRIFPFVSATIDVSSLAGINAVGIKLYGSYSKQNILSQTNNTQLTGVDLVNTNTLATQTVINNSGLITYYPAAGYNPLKTFNNYMAGADISITPLIAVNYTFERGYLLIPVTYSANIASGNVLSYTIYTNTKYTRNRIGLNFNIINKGTIRFVSGINAANIHQRLQLFNAPADLGKKMWTGGWVNRLEYNNIFAGLDVLYQTGAGNSVNPYVTYYPLIPGQNAHSFSLQNIYFGYKLQTKQFKNLEVFANGRNVWQNKKSDITDNRRFYGVGFKLGL